MKIAFSDALRLLPLLLSALLATPGCDATNDDAPTYWQDVSPILEGRCVTCHYQGGIGGFDLSSYEQASSWASAIATSTTAGTMPPWPASNGPSYDYNWSLSDDQIEVLSAWAQAGAPAGDPESPGSTLPTVGSSLSRVDLSVIMPEAYSPRSDWSDDYRCFAIPWTETEPTHITGFNAVPGNTAVVHHIAAFLVSSDNLLGDSVFEQLADWEAGEEGAGYTCFGGPSGPGGDLQLPIQQIAQWVPGSQGLDFPAGTGIKILPGSYIVLQVHYNSNPATPEASDQSTIELRLDDDVERKGAFTPWLDMSWALGDMEIPPLVNDWSFTTAADPRNFFELLNPDLDLEAGFTIYSAMLHMHRLGTSAEVHVLRADGSQVPLVEVPRWDFDWQLSYQLSEPVVFHDGDQLSLTCTYDNTEDGAIRTNWGEGTDDEMCVANLYITPL
jgi:hypothetical protein